MKIQKGLKVINQYGETRTVLSIFGRFVKTYEEYNNYYHTDKLYHKGKSLTTIMEA